MESEGLNGEDETVLRIDTDDPDLDHDEDLYWWYRGELFTGEIAEYHPNGTMIGLDGYKGGKLDGWSRSWYPDGTLKRESFHANRQVVGIARDWHPNGMLAEENVFEDGSLVDIRNWDEEGNFIVRAPTTRGFAIPEDAETAGRIERMLIKRVRRVGPIPAPLYHVAAVDLRYLDADTLAASAVTFDAESLAQVEATSTQHALKDARAETMNFEEVLAAIEALRGLEFPAGVIVCPGDGPNHPAEFNIATHIGVRTGKPTFGVSGSAYLGTYAEPGPERGAWTDLVDDGVVIGRALRTLEGEAPVFVTYGQRLGLDEAAELTLQLTRNSRLPVVSTAAEAALPSADA